MNGSPYSGTGYFKFAVVDSAGTTSYWSNDDTSAAGSEPTYAVELWVSGGLFNVLLGDTSLTNMTQALSAGQQQRVALAATLSPRPSLIVLDEPTIGQDWAHLVQVMDFLADLNQAGQTILLITHDERLVKRYASRVLTLQRGQVRQQADCTF